MQVTTILDQPAEDAAVLVSTDADQPEQPDVYPADADDAAATAPTASPLYAAYASGSLAVYRLRGNGTARRVPRLTGEALEHAEYMRLRRDECATIRQIAEECGLSRSTVRRTLWTLILVDAMADGELDDLYEPGDTELCLGGLGEDEDEDDETADEA